MLKRRRRVLAGLAAGLGLAAVAWPAGALGHGLVVARKDVPIPEWLFAWGASIVLIVSFVGLSFAWKEARFEDYSWRAVRERLSRLLINPVTEVLAGAVGVFLLLLIVYAGLQGTAAPDRNFAVPFVFVTFWLGLVLLSVLFGDVFRAFNPWRAIARLVAAVFRGIAGQPAPAPLRYPDWLGRWPSVLVIFAFVWFELFWGFGTAGTGLSPHDTAIAALVYSVYVFVGMSLFGIDTWLDRGEGFSVYFGMFARLSPLEVREGRLGLRTPLAGATTWATERGSVAFVLTAIGLTAFDGAQEGALAEPIKTTYEWIQDLGWFGLDTALQVNGSIWMALSIGAIAGIYWLGILGMHSVPGSLPTRELGRRFAHSFIPIAFAYVFAHYFSLFVFLEQAQFTYLLSDPLGEGSNIFGTADSGIDYGLIGANAIWYTQVGALLIGHVAALVLGHDRALAVYGDVRSATRSQYWMLTLMIGFTSLGLFLLSQANA